MHILEQYALNCGVKIDKPFINELFFPLPFDKYITFHPKGKFPSREYDYWEEVLLQLSPILEKENIKIVQIGAPKDNLYPYCYHTNGQTNFNHVAYLIRNSILHLGVDSFPIHIASAYNKKIVGLYCNMYNEQSGPYWSDKKDVRLLQADLNGDKPSYAAVENPKTINRILPENITNSVLDLLNIKEKINTKSLYFGNSYHLKNLEIIPDHVPNLNQFSTDVANVRMDYHFNEENLFNILRLYKTNILTSKAIDVEKLASLRQNILSIYFIINRPEDLDVKFLKKLKNTGINFLMVSFISEKEIQSIKTETMDLGNIAIEDLSDNINVLNNLSGKNMKFKSSKALLSNGKIYPCFSFYKQNRPYNLNVNESFDLQKDIDFSKELKHFYIFS